jgi:Protein of unknown function (DUF4238)
MADNKPRSHHYAPQFYLRNFAFDAQQTKVFALTKHGERAVWQAKSIGYLGVEDDLYTVTVDGVLVSMERTIGRNIESPISESVTWEKISTGRAESLSLADKPIIYALIRHFESRTPHAAQTTDELIQMCKDHPENFSEEEREMYFLLGQNPEFRAEFFASRVTQIVWSHENYQRALITICRTNIPLRTSTTPVHSVAAPRHPALHLPLPGQVPYTLTMTLNRHTFACLTLGDFEPDTFSNLLVPDDVARGYNRQRAAQFAYFPANAHLITDRQDLIEDMTWAPYDVELERSDKITFRRRNDQ